MDRMHEGAVIHGPHHAIDWDDEFEPRPLPRSWRRGRLSRDAVVRELKERLEALRNEVRRVESELMDVIGEDAAGRP